MDGCRLNGYFPCHTHGFLHSACFRSGVLLAFPYPRVCEIGVIVVVVCLVRSVLLIGGYYTYSNLFCLVSCPLFHPVCHAVCAPSLDSTKFTTTPSHLDTRLCHFLFCFFPLWFVRVIIRAFDSALFFHSLIDRISPSVALHPHHTYFGLVWSATSTSSPFLPRTLCTLYNDMNFLTPKACDLCSTVNIRVNIRTVVK